MKKLATVGDALDETARKELEENPHATGEALGKVVEFNQRALEEAGIPDRVRLAVIDELSTLITSRWPTIWRNYAAAFQAFAEDNPDTDKKFSFPLKTAVTLCPLGRMMGVAAGVAYGVRRKHLSEGQTVQLELGL